MRLSNIAKSIWQAGIDAVKSDQLLQQAVRFDANQLQVANETISLKKLQHIQVLGCGKAGRGMAVGLTRALANLPPSISVDGFINVPADCAEPLAADFTSPEFTSTRCPEIAQAITLHPARPAGINEPTEAGFHGTREILKRLQNQKPSGLTIFLVSGGGSALLENTRPGISLEDLLAVTRHLAQSGATIEELNTVRTQLSEVKGGGLLAHANQGQLVSLIVSDVISDPLHFIASGPCVPSSVTIQDVLTIWDRYADDLGDAALRIRSVLQQPRQQQKATVRFSNHLIGSNSVASTAAVQEAQRQGFQVILLGNENCGEAADLGRRLAERLQQLRKMGRPETGRGYCVIAGGETTVTMSPNGSLGKGGRNQEVVLAALAAYPTVEAWHQISFLSGGTDGEDGPTDAAGAFVDETIVQAATDKKLPLHDFLARHDSYPLFQAIGGLLKTGPTHTNVMDLAVGIVSIDSGFMKNQKRQSRSPASGL